MMTVTTDSPVVSVENMIMPPSQPRRDGDDETGLSTRRPGTQRKTFPSVGAMIPGEGE